MTSDSVNDYILSIEVLGYFFLVVQNKMQGSHATGRLATKNRQLFFRIYHASILVILVGLLTPDKKTVTALAGAVLIGLEADDYFHGNGPRKKKFRSE